MRRIFETVWALWPVWLVSFGLVWWAVAVFCEYEPIRRECEPSCAVRYRWVNDCPDSAYEAVEGWDCWGAA